MLSEDFWTLSGPGTAQTRVLGSRFIGRAFPLDDEVNINVALEAVKKLYHDASHHCWASIERKDQNLIQMQSDAGEPKGTAGQPILLEIRRHNLENCGVIVTRWFGGTKLGTGGLVRAYSECASLALDAAPRVLKKTGISVEVEADYELQKLVYQLAMKFFAFVEHDPDGNGKKLRVRLRRKQADEFISVLHEQSSGKLIGRAGSSWIS
ncbi:YigZ family protein [bacterium]|nr:YigZ family protein [bacterium]